MGLQEGERLVHTSERALPTLLFSSGPRDWQGLCLPAPASPFPRNHQKVPLTQTLYCTQVKSTQTDKEWAEG